MNETVDRLYFNVIGDPAVRLRVAPAAAEATPRQDLDQGGSA